MLIKQLYTLKRKKIKQISQILFDGEKCNNYLKTNTSPSWKD